MKRLIWGYVIKPYKFRVIAIVLCILLTSVASSASGIFLGKLIDNYITPLSSAVNPDFHGLFMAILGMGGIFLAGIVCEWLRQWLMITLGQGVLRDVRDSMFEHMQTLPIKYFDTNTYGKVMSHFTNDTDTLRQLITMTLPQAVTSLITIVVVFISMVSVSIWLTIVVLLFVALMLFITGKLGGLSSKFFIKQQYSLAVVNGYIEEMVSGQKVVKVFCHEDIAKKEFDECNDELWENATSANTLTSILMPILGNMGNLQYAVIAIAGGALAVAGMGISLGNIASFLQLSRNFTMPVTQISEQFNSVVMAMAGAGRIFKLLDAEPETDDGDVTLVNAVENADGTITETSKRTNTWAWKRPNPSGGYDYTKLTGDVVLSNVDFGYTPEKIVLHDVSLYAEPGQKVAFVGATGAGKTTITNLINRFYDIQDGTITYDGIPVKEIKKADLRRSLGMVLQDVNLFTGTVRENIRYGKLDATDEEIVAAAKLANAHGFISMLPEGYDTVLSGDGSGLSQGQRQLLAIARCAVADPPVMILDEATSSIDTRTEALVQKGMDRLMQGRTTFVIAHRLSTVQNSDVIMVLENGRIIERGNHDELIEHKGKYYQLYTGNFEEVE
ncbi:MAG: ABC transporter ATP-binding protein [Clostridiales bacterium]|nr:ABC transporter ATP-binding protein [Clostridiales bacterium]